MRRPGSNPQTVAVAPRTLPDVQSGIPRPTMGSMTSTTTVTTAGDADAGAALLAIAHGTRDPRGAEELAELLVHVRERSGRPAAGAWLEDFAAPSPAEAAAELVAGGARRLVTVPFLAFGAGHAKTDVPAGVAAVRDAHRDLEVTHGAVLGLDPLLFELARRRVEAVAGPPDADGRGRPRRPDDEALLVTGSGSSDPDANGDLAKAARFLAELTGHRWVDAAYAGVTWPDVGTALGRMAAAGARSVVLFSWSLLAGLLEQRVLDATAQVAAAAGVEVRDAGRFGPDPVVADVVLARADEAVAGVARMNCDLCQFRLPLPGREARVGAPSAGGTGERVHPAARVADGG